MRMSGEREIPVQVSHPMYRLILVGSFLVARYMEAPIRRARARMMRYSQPEPRLTPCLKQRKAPPMRKKE